MSDLSSSFERGCCLDGFTGVSASPTAPLGKPEPATLSRPSGRVSTDADRAWQLLETWFFRECNTGTRRHLFGAFGLPLDEIRNHGIERHCLRYIRRQILAQDEA